MWGDSAFPDSGLLGTMSLVLGVGDILFAFVCLALGLGLQLEYRF